MFIPIKFVANSPRRIIGRLCTDDIPHREKTEMRALKNFTYLCLLFLAKTYF